MNLVWLLNLKFLRRVGRHGGRNFKFATLAFCRPAAAAGSRFNEPRAVLDRQKVMVARRPAAKERVMEQRERPNSDLGKTEQPLSDQELEAANGGTKLVAGLGGPDTRKGGHEGWIDVLSYSW
jgi:hypothetical protein